MLSTFGWSKYAKWNIGVDSFGASAPMNKVMEAYGFTPKAIANKISKLIK